MNKAKRRLTMTETLKPSGRYVIYGATPGYVNRWKNFLKTNFDFWHNNRLCQKEFVEAINFF